MCWYRFAMLESDQPVKLMIARSAVPRTSSTVAAV
jgi:hypothetical protein